MAVRVRYIVHQFRCDVLTADQHSLVPTTPHTTPPHGVSFITQSRGLLSYMVFNIQYLVTDTKSFVSHHYSKTSFLYNAFHSLHSAAKMPEIFAASIDTLTAEVIAMFDEEVM